MCVAENALVWDLLAPKVNGARAVPASALGYDVMTGSLRFRERLAHFLGRSVLGRAVQPEQIAVLAGAGSVLEMLFYAIADPGDGVLVPTPSYAGFWLDLEVRDELAIVPVHCASTDGFALTTERLDDALARAARPVRALLFTTPNNPLGAVYSPSEIETIAAWADRAGIHVVFDEIYAMSVFGGRQFTSVAALRPSLGERIHIVWAFSKDFAASGLRCGLLISENQRVHRAVGSLAYWACCSGDTQHLLGEMVADDSWVDAYVTTMRARLGDAYRAATACLTEHGIAFIPAEAGFFFLLDLRRFLPEPTWEGERTLWRRILEQANVNLTPGSACRIVEPGFARLCFAAQPVENALAGIQRMAAVLTK